MTTERHQAYIKAMKILNDLKASKLNDAEFMILEDAAEARLLSDPNSEYAIESLEKSKDLLANLVGCQRWTHETANELLEQIELCATAQNKINA